MSIDLWYKHQVESNLIITGDLEVTDLLQQRDSGCLASG